MCIFTVKIVVRFVFRTHWRKKRSKKDTKYFICTEEHRSERTEGKKNMWRKWRRAGHWITAKSTKRLCTYCTHFFSFLSFCVFLFSVSVVVRPFRFITSERGVKRTEFFRLFKNYFSPYCNKKNIYTVWSHQNTTPIRMAKYSIDARKSAHNPIRTSTVYTAKCCCHELDNTEIWREQIADFFFCSFLYAVEPKSVYPK